MSRFEDSLAWAQDADESDPLKTFRSQFIFPKDQDDPILYFCGNSLGLQPKTTKNAVLEELDAWGHLAVEGHFLAKKPWFDYHTLLTDGMASVVGAKKEEVVCMNSLTVNLHLLMVSFYRPQSHRYKIVIEKGAFPSDQYAVASQARFHGYNPLEAIIELTPREGEHTIRTEDCMELFETKGHEIALVLLGGVNYFTGQLFDIQNITSAAQSHGCVVGLDLAHAAGNVPLELHQWNVDFAAWCSYKYLNAGPGGISAVFIHTKHLNSILPRFEGWWGHQKDQRFAMPRHFSPIATAEAWQLSNPPILLLAALHASLSIFEAAGMERLRAKSTKLTAYLEYLVEKMAGGSIQVITPSEPEKRGAQLSLKLQHIGQPILKELKNKKVICDFREPDIIRVAPVPLYNSFEDVFQFAQRLEACL